MVKNAIIHVEDSTNIIDFAKFLNDSGWNIFSADKTENLLKNNNIPVIHEHNLDETNNYLDDHSHFMRKIMMTKIPEYENEKEDQNNNDNIQIICLNVIPSFNFLLMNKKNSVSYNPTRFFILTIIHNAYINYENLLILTDPDDYKEAMIQLRTESVSKEFRLYLASKALNLISSCDSGISASIFHSSGFKAPFMKYLAYPFKNEMSIKGSNEHQKACIYNLNSENTFFSPFTKTSVNELNYNIASDISFAWQQITTLYSFLKNQFTVKTENNEGYEFTTRFTPLTGTVFTVAVKFNSIVGASLSTNVLDSFKQTYNYDYENIKDVVLACNTVIDFSAAQEIIKCDFATIVAPGFTDEAKEEFLKNPKIKLLSSVRLSALPFDAKLSVGGIILQQRDSVLFDHWKVKTKNRPTQIESDELAFGFILAMGSLSYSTILLKNNSIVGISQKCTSVIESLKNLVNNSNNFGEVLVSDSPLPFCQLTKQIIDNGVKSIIQPGGTETDEEFINYCNEKNIIMVFTEMSHITI